MTTIAKPIKMVLWTQEDGRIHPLRFQLKRKDGSEQVCQITRVFGVDENKFSGNKTLLFNSEFKLDDRYFPCILKYELESCRWWLFKV